jgi:GWxTD domain-containing protein
MKLSTDQQRDEFVVAFWNHHNPAGAPENSFKAEHYRRLAYANDHFAATLPGWETDRGHVYVVYGPPDSIDRNETNNSGYPYQIWHYRNVQSENKELTVRFVDTCRCGNFLRELTPPNENAPEERTH